MSSRAQDQRIDGLLNSRHSRIYPCPKGDIQRVEILLRRPA